MCRHVASDKDIQGQSPECSGTHILHMLHDSMTGLLSACSPAHSFECDLIVMYSLRLQSAIPAVFLYIEPTVMHYFEGIEAGMGLWEVWPSCLVRTVLCETSTEPVNLEGMCLWVTSSCTNWSVVFVTGWSMTSILHVGGSCAVMVPNVSLDEDKEWI